MTDRRFRIEGSPTPEEEAAVIAALERLLVAEDRERRRPSAWKLAGRPDSTRMGPAGLRTTLGERPWALADRPAWAGRAWGHLRDGGTPGRRPPSQ